MNIFLVGLPGSGKSTIGKTLSLLTGFSFRDTDEIISEKEKDSIEEIFKTKGEAYFRKCEEKILNELTTGNNLVISTGGGLPCFFDNMRVINENGVSIFLNVHPSTIADRLWTTENFHRPLIKGKNKEQLHEFLVTKLEERIPYYRQSRFEFSGDSISAEEIISKLKADNVL